jgi:hypothetical protein
MLLLTFLSIGALVLLITELVRRILVLRADLAVLRQFHDARARTRLEQEHQAALDALTHAIAAAVEPAERRRLERTRARKQRDWHRIQMQWDAWEETRLIIGALRRSPVARARLGLLGVFLAAALLIVSAAVLVILA